jgi:DnaJ-domain-containing protein 1
MYESSVNKACLRYLMDRKMPKSASTLPMFVNISIRCIRYSVSAITISPKFRAPEPFLVRLYSSSTNQNSSYHVDALPFTVSPDEALEKFYKWSDKEQSIKFLLRSVYISAVYVPVWSFDLNVRFATLSQYNSDLRSNKRYDLKPDPFSIYENDVIHIPGMSAYAGYSYRRSLVDPIHNTSLVFLGNKTHRFGSWMLQNMTLANGRTLTINADPWNATKGRAFEVVLDNFKKLADQNSKKFGPCKVEAEVLKARRVYMPTYAVSYRVLGAEYQAFVSGCDDAAGVSGVSHAVWSSQINIQIPSNFLQRAIKVAQQTAGPVGLVWLGQTLLGLLARILTRFPHFAAIGAVFVGFRKFIQPWYVNLSDSAEWERQRDRESQMLDRWSHTNDFVDNGSARSYFERNKFRLLRHLSGGYEHVQGNFTWYHQWEEWARQNFQQQAQQQWYEERQQGGQKAQQQTGRRRPEPNNKRDYKWEFDPNDPYSVLGIKRGASKSEVSDAFRREMLKYHPDTQTSASGEEKQKFTERSKLISEAYRKIRNSIK